MENILKIFTSEDEKEIKQSFKEVLIGQFGKDLDENNYYLFNPDEVNDIINEAVEEVMEDFKVELRKRLEKTLQSIDMNKLLKSIM